VDRRDWLRDSLTAIVAIHLINALWHGLAHVGVPVALSGSQTAFVVLVILILPLAGAAWLWTGRMRTGAALIAGSMLGSLVFGFINHFIRATPDNVLAVPAGAWQHSFEVSAALLVLTETAGSVLGAVGALGQGGPGYRV
jgi:hypothetical protein